jgi:glycosyltransferase 2 family protein
LQLSRSKTLWIGIAVGAVLLWLATRAVDRDALVAALGRARLSLALPFLLLLVGFYVLKALRWGVLLAPVARVPTPLLFRAVIIGYASNAILPAQLGDVVRAIVTSREMGLRLAPIVTTLVVERALDLLVVVTLLAAAAVLLPDVPDALEFAGAAVTLVCLLALALLFSYGRHTDTWIRGLQHLLAGLPEGIRQRIGSQANAGADGARALAEPGPFLLVVGQTFLKWMLVAGCNLISLVALGIEVPPVAAVLVLACTVLALLLPSAPGYVGAIQIAYVIALKPFGVSPSEAVAASLFFHAFAYGFVVLAGWYYLHAGGYRIADLKAQIERHP